MRNKATTKFIRVNVLLFYDDKTSFIDAMSFDSMFLSYKNLPSREALQDLGKPCQPVGCQVHDEVAGGMNACSPLVERWLAV